MHRCQVLKLTFYVYAMHSLECLCWNRTARNNWFAIYSQYLSEWWCWCSKIERKKKVGEVKRKYEKKKIEWTEKVKKKKEVEGNNEHANARDNQKFISLFWGQYDIAYFVDYMVLPIWSLNKNNSPLLNIQFYYEKWRRFMDASWWSNSNWAAKKKESSTILQVVKILKKIH